MSLARIGYMVYLADLAGPRPWLKEKVDRSKGEAAEAEGRRWEQRRGGDGNRGEAGEGRLGLQFATVHDNN
jgi:hypothetical protein